MNARGLMMRNPRPGYGRVNGIYYKQGSTGYGHFEPLTEGEYIIIPTDTNQFLFHSLSLCNIIYRK